MVANKVVTELVVKGANKTVEALRKQQTEIKRGMSGTTKGLLAVGASAAGAAASFLAFGSQVASTFERFNPQAQRFSQQIALLRHQLEDMPKDYGSDVSFDQAVKQMRALYDNTSLTASELVYIQATIARTTKDTEVLAKAAQTVADVVAARQGSMSSEAAAQWMTTVLGDPGRTADKLRRVEVQLSAELQKQLQIMVEQGRVREAQLLLLDVLNERFAGSAKVASEAYGGVWAKMERDVDNLGTRFSLVVGKELLPFLEELSEALNGEQGDDLIRSMRDIVPVMVDIAEVFGGIAKFFLDATDGLTSVYATLKDDIKLGLGSLPGQVTNLYRGVEAIGEGGSEGEWVLGFRKAIFEITGDARAAEIQIRKTADALKEVRTPAINESAQVSKAAVERALAEKRMMDAMYAAQKAEEERIKALEKSTDRLRARLNTISVDMETPIEKLRRYAAMLDEYRASVEELGNAEEKLAFARELEKKIIADYIEGVTRPLKDLTRKYKGKMNPFLQMKEDMEAMLDAAKFSPRADTKAGLQGLLDAVNLELAKINDVDESFTSTSAGPEDLYSTIRDSLLEQEDKVPAAIEAQTKAQKKFLEDLAKQLAAAIAGLGPKTLPVAPVAPRPGTPEYYMPGFTPNSGALGEPFVIEEPGPVQSLQDALQDALDASASNTQELISPVEKVGEAVTRGTTASIAAADRQTGAIVDAINSINTGMVA